MVRRFALLALLTLTLLVACAEEESPFEPESQVLSVPSVYATLAAAVAVAEAGDRIVVEYRPDAYAGDFTLPADVTLRSFAEDPFLPIIEGQITVVGGDASAQIFELIITNESGPALVIQDSDIALRNLWIRDCAGAGMELRGNSHSQVTGCDFENCERGVLIEGITQSADYLDEDHPAAQIADCNFIANGEPGNLDDITFENVPVFYRISVTANYWGEGIGDPDDAIWDNKDDSGILGIAHTDAELFLWRPQLISRWWRD